MQASNHLERSGPVSVLEMGLVFGCVSMCQFVLVCVVFVVLLLPSMRWLLCGGDSSKKKKTTSVISEKSRERIFHHYGLN